MTKSMIPAAGYLRMSSDRQDKSIDGQKVELLEYAKARGFNIVRWYTDEGISGWKSKQRLAFQSLIEDAKDGEFKAVLCWDQSRFSRFDPMEANFYWHSLRVAGVFIETVKEGKLDFETLGGWLTASVQQHGKAEYVRSLAADVVRGRRKQIMAGKWISCPPYGYRLEKGSGKLTLGDPIEIETVQRVFKMRSQGVGARGIVRALHADSIPSPRGHGRWSQSQIRMMLLKESYIGNTVVGNWQTGKFEHVTDHRQVFENTHQPIIDRTLWQQVQAINATRRSRGPGHKRRDVGAQLSGLLYCADCGSKMICDRRKQRYICGTNHSAGGCFWNTVHYDVAMAVVAQKIRDVVLRGSVENLTAKIAKVVERRKSSRAQTDAAAIKRQIGEIDRKLGAAAERLLEVEASLVGNVRAVMLTLKEKREALAARLEQAAADQRKPMSAKQIAGKLWEIDRLLREGDPVTVRGALRRLIDRIDLEFQHIPRKRNPARHWHFPAGGTIFLSSIEDTFPKI